jgi:CRISPR/Cas system-associated protein Cas10 (large subunit of type III CRISPR-Cas system)
MRVTGAISTCVRVSTFPETPAWAGFLAAVRSRQKYLAPKQMEQAKEIVRTFNQSEVLHLLNYIFKTRDDVLFLYAMTRQEIKMDEENLRDFKKWLTENKDIVMACIESALPSLPSDGGASDVSGDEDFSSSASVGRGSNAAGGGGGADFVMGRSYTH